MLLQHESFAVIQHAQMIEKVMIVLKFQPHVLIFQSQIYYLYSLFRQFYFVLTQSINLTEISGEDNIIFKKDLVKLVLKKLKSLILGY